MFESQSNRQGPNEGIQSDEHKVCSALVPCETVEGVALEHGDDRVVIEHVQKEVHLQVARPNNATGIQFVEVNQHDPLPHFWRQIWRQFQQTTAADARPVQLMIRVGNILSAGSGGHGSAKMHRSKWSWKLSEK